MSNKNPETINVPHWWVRPNGSWIARFALAWDHPESEYQYILNVLKLVPEDYGCFKDERELNEVREMSDEDKTKEILRLRETIRGYEKAGF